MMFDKLKLLRGLRKIWFGVSVVTPKMVVDTIKLFYTFITGKVPCLFMVAVGLLVVAPCDAAPRYRLTKPRVVKSYRLSRPTVASQPTRSTNGSATTSRHADSNRKLSEKRTTFSDKADSLIVVSATWCQPCKRLYPVIAELSKEGYEAKVVYEVPENANVSAYPTLLFYRGGKIVDTLVGVQTKAEIKRRLAK
jgi:thioredoxin 1